MVITLILICLLKFLKLIFLMIHNSNIIFLNTVQAYIFKGIKLYIIYIAIEGYE